MRREYLEIGFSTIKDKRDFQSYCNEEVDIVEVKGGVQTPKIFIHLLGLGIMTISQIITEYLTKNPDKEIIIGGRKINAIWVSRAGVLSATLSEIINMAI